MEQLARIEARLESLAELGDLVGALRSMAAARLREAQDAFGGTRAYSAIVSRAIAEAAPRDESVAAADGEAAPGQGRLLVLTSENGFVGGFNERLIARAAEARAAGEALILVGRRGQIVAAEQGLAVASALPMTSRVQGVGRLARRLAADLAGATSARIVVARYQTGGGFEPELRRVLPVEPPAAPGPSGAAPAPPILHLPAPVLMRRLASEYLFAQVADALVESLASENAARMRTMDAAARNIDDRLETLTRQQRAARQEQTTADMLDVVTGAEAVSGRRRARL